MVRDSLIVQIERVVEYSFRPCSWNMEPMQGDISPKRKTYHKHSTVHSKVPAGQEGQRDVLRALEGRGRRHPRIGGEERRERRPRAPAPPRPHGHAVRLENLERALHVEYGLHAGRHHDHGGAGQLDEVGGYVEAELAPAVDAACAPGDEGRYPRDVCEAHGGGDGRGAPECPPPVPASSILPRLSRRRLVGRSDGTAETTMAEETTMPGGHEGQISRGALRGPPLPPGQG